MQSFYIESLHVKNVRQFEELNVKFNRHFNFIAGPNGCGKTSILTCISHCFHHSNFKYSRFKDGAEFWTDLVSGTDKFRLGLGSGAVDIKGYRASSIRSWVAPMAEVGREIVITHRVKEQLQLVPLFLGAHRSIKYKKIAGMKREEVLDNQLASYTSEATQALYGDKEQDIKQWFINRYFMVDKDWATEEKINWEHLINSLPSIGPFDSEFAYIKTGKDLEPVFSLYGEECYLEELSAGFQAVLIIIANIFEWIEACFPEGRRKAIDASGTVLIDELDLHLHPEWQFTLRNGLEKMFPNLQFIVTTHSPHLLASAQSGEVIVMPKERGERKYDLKSSDKMYSGWSTDQILSEIMGVKSLENKKYEQLIVKAYENIEAGSVVDLEKTIRDLQLVAHPSDSIVTVLKVRLASMVAIQND